MTRRPITPAMLESQARGMGMASGTPEAIVASEAAGQQSLVNSDLLPKESRPTLEQCERNIEGLVVGKDIDDLFVSVALPQGWSKKATDHNMWSELLDDQGRLRASIFYKAAFYDRKAHMVWKCFVYIDSDYETGEVLVLDRNGSVLHTIQGDKDEVFPTRTLAQEWVNKNYDDAQNPFAYWES